MKVATPAPPAMLDGTGRRFSIAASRYNHPVTQRLVEGAVTTLVAHGVSPPDVRLLWVPGSFELPFAAQQLAHASGVSAVICLGCIIKGETNHDELVAHAVATGITQVGLGTGVPILFGVISVNDLQQAIARSGGTVNRGSEAAKAALEMAAIGESP